MTLFFFSEVYEMSMNVVESNTIKVNIVIAVRLRSIFNNSHRLYPTQLGVLCHTPISNLDNKKNARPQM